MAASGASRQVLKEGRGTKRPGGILQSPGGSIYLAESAVAAVVGAVAEEAAEEAAAAVKAARREERQLAAAAKQRAKAEARYCRGSIQDSKTAARVP